MIGKRRKDLKGEVRIRAEKIGERGNGKRGRVDGKEGINERREREVSKEDEGRCGISKEQQGRRG